MQFRPTGWIGTIRVSGPRRRFNPAEVTRQYAELCKQYRITVKDVQASAGALGMSVDIVYASTESEIDAAFTTLAQNHADALLIAPDEFFKRAWRNSPRRRCIIGYHRPM